MAHEIERKFLVAGNDWRKEIHASHRMTQGYLNNELHCSVRIRTCGEQAWLNIKSATIGSSRLEFEYEIPIQDALDMLGSLRQSPLIEKVRHLVRYRDHLWEIDEFEGDNSALIVAEIELSSPEEYFEKPAWLGREVTEDIRYYNTQLSKHPFNSW
ncbi:CYTH domain-containing protein [Candidatus Methylospira mobilis]|uniref:CYTH domain-containing protein n=1 Tax=Candidatus Methylospira mobilis TaxID=1808979 RepID=UPI0028EDF231|nr:CYTH domain-containing protein [Candidatus Methylospira mobilis]WNV03260.1 CYTH domain-containing protein [Candidatus Methylospira mobilis]